jgi:molybdenum cofactor synthesis domain-containing protein
MHCTVPLDTASALHAQPAPLLLLRPPQADKCGCCLVVTTGGTGPAPRDVTPEATEAVCQRMMPGYGEQMRAISLKYVPTAVLSRQTAGEGLRVQGSGWA